MASQTATFRNQVIGDVFTIAPDHQPLAAPVRQAGVFQSVAALACDSPNFNYALIVTLHLVEATNIAAVETIAAIQALVGLRGKLLIKTDGVTKITCNNWMLVAAPAIPLDPGFGGRRTESLELRFEGETREVYA